MNAIEPFPVEVAETAIAQLRQRLEATRWPTPQTGATPWQQGPPLERQRALCAYWAGQYDWSRLPRLLNGFGSYHTVIDGLSIHFLHARSSHENALPLLITHGWPGSVLEFAKVIGPLTDPVAHGGAEEDAFDVVAPALPGFGFSGKPAAGWDFDRTATAWIELMRRLGYPRWVAQGGDLGSAVTEAIGRMRPAACAAIHLNMSYFRPTPQEVQQATPEELGFLADAQRYFEQMTGYAAIQGTRPQTIGYALEDSPAGLAAWIYDKFHDGTGDLETPESGITLDDILDNVMLYWLPAAATSAARFYWEIMRSRMPTEPLPPIEMPTAYSVFPNELIKASRRWMARRFTNLTHYRQVPRGGHFAALDQPHIFVEELRTAFRWARKHPEPSHAHCLHSWS